MLLFQLTSTFAINIARVLGNFLKTIYAVITKITIYNIYMLITLKTFNVIIRVVYLCCEKYNL